MSDVPYDIVVPVPIATLTNVTFGLFMDTPVQLRKRQVLSFSASISTEELVRMCPLSNVQGADVVAGCIAGIYNKFCFNPSNATLLRQCHDAYNRVFDASIFKPLGAVCPAWRNGPYSLSCQTAVNNFQHRYLLGYQKGVAIYLDLNRIHAQELVSNIFGQRKYAPCQAPVACFWEATRG